MIQNRSIKPIKSIKTIKAKKPKVIKLICICILATVMNIALNYFFMTFLRFPLFLDTVFTAAVTFAFGFIPGVSVALFWPLILWILNKSFNFFVLCIIAEVLLICALKPDTPEIPAFATKEKIIASYTGVATKLMLLYVICAISISVLGGVLNYILQIFLGFKSQFYSPEDIFKLGLIMNNLPTLAVNILSRIPVNIVDRFIVIFGGYFISRLFARLII